MTIISVLQSISIDIIKIRCRSYRVTQQASLGFYALRSNIDEILTSAHIRDRQTLYWKNHIYIFTGCNLLHPVLGEKHRHMYQEYAVFFSTALYVEKYSFL